MITELFRQLCRIRLREFQLKLQQQENKVSLSNYDCIWKQLKNESKKKKNNGKPINENTIQIETQHTQLKPN